MARAAAIRGSKAGNGARRFLPHPFRPCAFAAFVIGSVMRADYRCVVEKRVDVPVLAFWPGKIPAESRSETTRSESTPDVGVATSIEGMSADSANLDHGRGHNLDEQDVGAARCGRWTR